MAPGIVREHRNTLPQQPEIPRLTVAEDFAASLAPGVVHDVQARCALQSKFDHYRLLSSYDFDAEWHRELSDFSNGVFLPSFTFPVAPGRGPFHPVYVPVSWCPTTPDDALHDEQVMVNTVAYALTQHPWLEISLSMRAQHAVEAAGCYRVVDTQKMGEEGYYNQFSIAFE